MMSSFIREISEVYMDHLSAKTGGGLDSYLIVYILNITESKKSNILQNI